MNKLTPFLLSAVFFSSTGAYNKVDKTSSNALNPTGNNTNSIKSNTAQNQQSTTVPAGTTFDAKLQEEISTSKDHNQERFTLLEQQPLIGGNQLLKGAQIEGHLEDVVQAARGKKASLHLVFDDIVLKDGTTLPIDATLVNPNLETKTQGHLLRNAGVILGGAVAGHFLGKRTGISHGAAAGATVASGYVLLSPGGEVLLKRGTDFKLKLNSPLETSA